MTELWQIALNLPLAPLVQKLEIFKGADQFPINQQLPYINNKNFFENFVLYNIN